MAAIPFCISSNDGQEFFGSIYFCGQLESKDFRGVGGLSFGPEDFGINRLFPKARPVVPLPPQCSIAQRGPFRQRLEIICFHTGLFSHLGRPCLGLETFQEFSCTATGIPPVLPGGAGTEAARAARFSDFLVFEPRVCLLLRFPTSGSWE